MIKGLAHVRVSAKDLAETERFYCGCLGLSKKFDFLREGKVIGYYLQIDEGSFVEVFQSDKVSSSRGQAITHFCLEVDDIERAIEEIRGFGVDITDKEMGCDHSWQAWVTDPSGVRIELHEYTDKSCQIVGDDCEVR